MTGRSFKLRRIEAGITQADVARLLGCSKGAVTMFEIRGAVREETVKQYEEALAILIAQREERR